MTWADWQWMLNNGFAVSAWVAVLWYAGKHILPWVARTIDNVLERHHDRKIRSISVDAAIAVALQSLADVIEHCMSKV